MHDSLDYHQLKVSVFNDDKKTDLIGETWVSLDPVLTPGGGKNDMWHSLNCRGRYAGEIRIELTYYDSRPREERPDEAIGSTPPPRSENGSRQQKPLKRRPLPANPTQSTANLIPSRGPRPLPGTSADSSFTPSMFRAQEQVNFSSQALSTVGDNEALEGPADDQSIAPERTFHVEERDTEAMNTSSAIGSVYDARGRDFYGAEAYGNPPYLSSSEDVQLRDSSFESRSEGLQLPELPPHTPRANRSSAAPTPKYYTPANSSPSFTLPQYERSPEQQNTRDPKQAYQNNQPYHSSPLRSQSMDDPYEHQQLEPYHEEARHLSLEYSPQHHDPDAFDIRNEPTLPPLPPPHTKASAIHADARDSRSHSLPAPVAVRPPRATVSGSPLSQVHTDHHPSNQFNPAPPSEYPSSTVSFPLSSNHDRTYDPRIAPNRQRDGSRTQANNELFIPDHQAHISHARSYPNMPQNENDYVTDEYNGPRTQQPRNHHTRSQYSSDYDMRSAYESRVPRHPQYNTPSPENHYSPSTAHSGHASVGRPHRASAPIISRRGVSPDPRTPSRKSVSPHPDSASRDSRMTSVPFSPDSYEQLNPNLSAAKSINVPNPKYNTPESIREAAHDFAKEEKLRTGPIVNSAGKVVDPSDHLPSDTWAPEPERKTPRKSHQINVKFRHHQSGTQSLPTSGQRLPPREPMTRPPVQPMPPVMHAHSAEDVLPVSAGRNRLQKRSGPAPVHFNSSPAVPMSHATPPSHVPLRENPNYGYASSPSYGRGHQSNRAPPIPAKVPLGGGQEDWGSYDMSDDFSNIDLGPGPGARPRRTQLRYAA